MALCMDPVVLMLDEPTEGLASALAQFFSEILKKIKIDYPILLVERNLPIVKEFADSLYLMREGKVIYHTEILMR